MVPKGSVPRSWAKCIQSTTSSPYFPKMNSNIFLPSTSRSSKWSLPPLWLPLTQTPKDTFLWKATFRALTYFMCKCIKSQLLFIPSAYTLTELFHIKQSWTLSTLKTSKPNNMQELILIHRSYFYRQLFQVLPVFGVTGNTQAKRQPL
jgi:hypothetical protein